MNRKFSFLFFIITSFIVLLFSCKHEIDNGDDNQQTVEAPAIELIDETPPAEVTDLTATVMDSKIMISWTEPSDEDFAGVEISCEPKAGSLENPMTLKKGVSSLIVYGLENGTEYTFIIKTFDTSGNFSAGMTCTGIPIDSSDKIPSAEATDFVATAMDSKAMLSWTEPEDDDFAGIEISCEPKAGTLENAVTLKKGSASIFVYGLENGTEYTFTIKTFDTSGNFSAGVTCTGTPIDSSDKTPPEEAGDFTAEPMDGAVKLSWIDATNDGLFGYELSWTPKSSVAVSRAVTAMDTDSIFVSPTENERNEISISNLLNGTEYTFTLKSMDTSGNKSEGVTVKGTPTTTPDVSRLTAIYYDGKTHISWSNPGGIEGVEIFADGKKVSCDVKTVASSVYGNYSYCVLENSLPGKSYIVKTKNRAGQFSSGMAVSAVETGLPVVCIDTENGVDVKDKVNKIPAKINILNSGDLKNPNPDAAITIKCRGNSSFDMPKKSYTIKLESESKVLGMEKHDSWALIANYADKTFLRNQMSYYMGREIFTNLAWTPDTRQVQFFLNGEYLGIYMIVESVKIDKKRVNITNLKKYAENGGDFEDYGWVLEANFRLDEYFNFKTNRNVCFSLKEPDGEKIEDSLRQKIKDYVQNAENALYSDEFDDENSENFYEKYFDEKSFIDYWIIKELSKDVDSPMFTSCYMYFDPSDKKLHMGPIWDFDRGWGQYGDASRITYEGYTTPMYAPSGFWTKVNYFYPNYLARLFESAEFTQKAKDRWNETFSDIESIIQNYIPSEYNHLAKEAEPNFARWKILGIQSNADAPGYENRTTYKSEVDYMANWFTERLNWLNIAINEL